MMLPVTDFFNIPANTAILRIVNTPTTPVSLRTIEWICSRAHAKGFAGLPAAMGGYADLVKSYGRKNFDPFRRSQKVTLTTPGGVVCTTEAQMNFFQWFISVGGWSWALKHKHAVQQVIARESGKGFRQPAANALAASQSARPPARAGQSGRFADGVDAMHHHQARVLMFD